MKRPKDITRVAHAREPAQRARRANTAVTREREAEPRLPHERDESADSQVKTATQQPGDVGKQAYDDVQAGRVDTDRGPVLEKLFRTALRRETAPAPPRKTHRTR
jgi:hypothetical protein